MGEGQPFVDEMLCNLSSIICDLSPPQVSKRGSAHFDLWSLGIEIGVWDEAFAARISETTSTLISGGMKLCSGVALTGWFLQHGFEIFHKMAMLLIQEMQLLEK